MSTVNPRKVNTPPPVKQAAPTPEPGTAHSNFMDGTSFTLNPIRALRLAAASCFFGEPVYYPGSGSDPKSAEKRRSILDDLKTEGITKATTYLDRTLSPLDNPAWRGLTPKARMERAIEDALDYSVIETLATAVQLRNTHHIRLTPQIILVRAAQRAETKNGNMMMFRDIMRLIVKRPDDAVNGMAYLLATYGRKGLTHQLEKGWRAYLQGCNAYTLAKYRLENKSFTLENLVDLVHPKGSNFDKLKKGELKLGEGKETWESYISSKGSSRETWTAAVDLMGHMALLRNLRNLIEHGVPISVWGDKLIDGVETGQQLPFRYLSAWFAVKSLLPAATDALNTCLERAYTNAPKFQGRVMSLADNSGSTSQRLSSFSDRSVADIGNLTSVVTAKLSDEGWVGVFGDRLATMPVPKSSSFFDAYDRVSRAGGSVGTGTECGIWNFFDKATREKQWWDHVFVYSDEQAGHGGLYGHGTGINESGANWRINSGDHSQSWGYNYIDVPYLINRYRSAVNPKVNVYLVQIAGYQDALVPETFQRTAILGGWSDAILTYAAEMAAFWNE